MEGDNDQGEFQCAMESLAEAWVAANTSTVLSESIQAVREHASVSDLPAAMLRTEQQQQQLLSQHHAPPTHNPTTHALHESFSHHQMSPLFAASSSGALRHQEEQQQRQNRKLSLSSSAIGGAGAQLMTSSPSSSPVKNLPECVKSVPIHCVVEYADPAASTKESPVDLDTYAILPGTTLFSELVHSTLIKIGYSNAEAVGAKGSIHFRYWKPLSFDAITDDPEISVQEILGELSSLATLHIALKRRNVDGGVHGDPTRGHLEVSPRHWTDERVRCVIVELLKEMNQSTLSKLSPLSQSAISNIVNSQYSSKISAEKSEEFGKWYHQYRHTNPVKKDNEFWCPPDSRLTFHPLYEIPKMRHWYEKFPNPSQPLFRQFLDEINSGPVRKQRRPVTLSKIKIWWKNEKQRVKKAKDEENTPKRAKSKRQNKGSRQPMQEDNVDVETFDSPSGEHSRYFNQPEMTSQIPRLVQDPMLSESIPEADDGNMPHLLQLSPMDVQKSQKAKLKRKLKAKSGAKLFAQALTRTPIVSKASKTFINASPTSSEQNSRQGLSPGHERLSPEEINAPYLPQVLPQSASPIPLSIHSNIAHRISSPNERNAPTSSPSHATLNYGQNSGISPVRLIPSTPYVSVSPPGFRVTGSGLPPPVMLSCHGLPVFPGQQISPDRPPTTSMRHAPT